MSLFDANMWYTVFPASNTSVALHGSNLTDGAGAAYFQPARTSGNELMQQQWQFFQHNDSYVLRTKGSGPNAYLVAGTPNGSAPIDIAGNTVPSMRGAETVDNSMFWQITSWKDGNFYFTNGANGTGWHLQLRGANNAGISLLAMSSNITGTQPQQEFKWKQQGTKIDDQAFSTIDTPTGTATTSASQAPETATPTSSSSALPSPSTSSSSSGLSTGAKAAIGASIGGLAIMIAIVAFIYIRRLKRRSPEYAAMLRNPKDIHEAKVAEGQFPHNGGEPPFYPPDGHQSYFKAELPSQTQESAAMTGELQPKVQPAETEARNNHVELPTEGRTHVAPVELGTGADER